jgi:hypothetical protein
VLLSVTAWLHRNMNVGSTLRGMQYRINQGRSSRQSSVVNTVRSCGRRGRGGANPERQRGGDAPSTSHGVGTFFGGCAHAPPQYLLERRTPRFVAL